MPSELSLTYIFDRSIVGGASLLKGPDFDVNSENDRSSTEQANELITGCGIEFSHWEYKKAVSIDCEGHRCLHCQVRSSFY